MIIVYVRNIFVISVNNMKYQPLSNYNCVFFEISC